MMQAPTALSQRRVLKTPGRGMGVLRTANASGALTLPVLKIPGFGHDASAFGALAAPGVENTRHRNGRPTDGKRLRRSRSAVQ